MSRHQENPSPANRLKNLRNELPNEPISEAKPNQTRLLILFRNEPAST
jgi:hypothetical protein